MLRSKPTRIALTEGDLCYHLDSIFSRHDQLSHWHRQGTDSNNSYDGDSDDDGRFLDSDAFSLPETLDESECSDSQSQTTTGDSPQDPRENATGPGERTESIITRHSSRLARDNDCQIIVRTGRAFTYKSPRLQRVESAHSLPPVLQLAFPSNTDWEGLSQAFASQHDLPTLYSLVRLGSGLCKPRVVVTDARFPKFCSSTNFLRLRLFCQKGVTGQSENSLKTLLMPTRPYQDFWIRAILKVAQVARHPELPSNHLPEIQLFDRDSTPRPKMKRSRRTMSVSPARDSCESLASEAANPPEGEVSAQGHLTEIKHNSGSAAQKISAAQDVGSSLPKRRSSTLGDVTTRRSRAEDIMNIGHLAHQNAASRATQTDPNLAVPPKAGGGATGNLRENHPVRQENIAPARAVAQPPFQQPRQDPFISAMFSEPGAPAYDPTEQINAGMQEYVLPPLVRGRIAGNQEGALVHPTLVDAARFQEYVQRLIAELDRAP